MKDTEVKSQLWELKFSATICNQLQGKSEGMYYVISVNGFVSTLLFLRGPNALISSDKLMPDTLILSDNLQVLYCNIEP